MNYLGGPIDPSNVPNPNSLGTWPTDTTGTGSGFFNTYQHIDDISYNQLMWADGCFRGGGSSTLENPYIDYPSKFYNPGTVFLKDYSSLDSSGDIIDYDIAAGQYWTGALVTTTLSGTYKWIVLEYTGLTSKQISITVKNISNSTLNQGDNYLMYICEKNTLYLTSSGFPYAGRSGWLDAQVKKPTGSLTAQSKDGQGVWSVSDNKYKLNFASSSNPSDIYLRIGIPSGQTIKSVELSV